MNIGIIGLGLIGGSLAKSVRKAITQGDISPRRLYGFDLSDEVMAAAYGDGVIDGSAMDNMADCSLVIIALPPKATITWAKNNAHRLSGKLVTDICGVKSEIYRHLMPLALEHSFTYVGTHPMAGREVTGYFNSSSDLFDGASMVLTPDESVPQETVDCLSELFLALGFGRITLATCEKHDKIIAYTSQLAHVASNGYIKSDAALEYKGFSAGSFKDLTRVAKLDENMWTELFEYNRTPLADELRILIGNLREYLDALESEDYDRLKALLRDGRLRKEHSISIEKD